MSTMFKGKRLKQTGWRNSETARVQKRVDSVIDSHRARVNNSLAVESIVAHIYKRARVGAPCSCCVVLTDNSDSDRPINAETVIAPREDTRQENSVGIVDNGMGGLFGSEDLGGSSIAEMEFDQPQYKTAHKGVREIELASVENPLGTFSGQTDNSAEDDGLYQEHALGGNTINCPICYRQGYVPAYQPIGYNYQVMTVGNELTYHGYRIAVEEQPHVFERVTDDGYVDFALTVPRFFKDCTWSIRTYDGELLPASEIPVALEGSNEIPLSLVVLDSYRGQRVRIRSRCAAFSHLIVHFNLGARDILCSVSEETSVLDYDKELTVANLTIVLPHYVGTLNPEDLIVLPSRNYVLMVTDTPKKRTSKDQTLEWVVQTRTIQRKEMFYTIHKGYKLR